MYKTYFKQAVEMLKQNKFFSIISISGTALAIMMIMAIIVTDSIKNVNAAPENNRDRTLYITYHSSTDSVKGRMTAGPLDIDIIKDCILLLNTPELISVYSNHSNTLVSSEVLTKKISLNRRNTDCEYWNHLSFSFLEGGKFKEEEFLSGVCNAIISESASRKLFNGESAIGKTIDIDFQQHRVIGVVKDVSPVFNVAYSDIWIPYTSTDNPSGFNVMLLVKNKSDVTAIKEELRIIEKKYQDSNPGKTLYLRGPETHRTKTMGIGANNDDGMIENAKIQNRKLLFILIIIMLVPAINLSGLNLSRIKRRTPEIGVRKAFGAKGHIILIQILCENIITSFTGGIIGLVLSVFLIFQMRFWLLKIPSDGSIPFDTIISIPVIISVFAACVIINILSAAIPAYRASRTTIVNAITNNDKES